MLARDTSLLVRQEVKLASTEMTTKAKHAARTLLIVAVGGATTLVGCLGLLVAALAALRMVMPLWLAALALGAAFACAGGILVRVGLSAFQRMAPLPRKTIQTLKDDVLWAKGALR